MSENAKKWLLGLLYFVIFVVCIVLIVVGQKTIGASYLGIMLLGLAGLIVLLWIYNRKYK